MSISAEISIANVTGKMIIIVTLVNISSSKIIFLWPRSKISSSIIIHK